jgi:hypothetical protein
MVGAVGKRGKKVFGPPVKFCKYYPFLELETFAMLGVKK